MFKRTWKYFTGGVVIALVASLVFILLPSSVNITQEGFLAVGANVVLAVGEEETREAGMYVVDGGYEYVFDNKEVVEIGDISTTDFKPHLKLNRWGGECWLILTPSGEIESEFEPELEEDKIKCKYKVKQGEFEFEWETEFYPLEPITVIAKDRDGNAVPFTQNELGGFEFEVILKETPVTNKIVLNIEAQGLKFYYQPELTPEEIAEGSVRPDNVVGSYAVYHATRTAMHRSKADAEKYKAGKAFHIYRPKITDAGGNWTWGELSLDENAGTLTIIIDQDWLDSAVYPIRIDPTFGEEIEGGTAKYDQNSARLSWFTCSEAGTASKITALLKAYNSGYEGDGKCALYKKSDDSLVQGTNITPITATKQEYDFTFSDGPQVSAQDYGLVWNTDNYTYGYYDSDTDRGKSRFLIFTSEWWNPFSGTVDDKIWTIYCTYTPADGAEISNTPDSKGFGVLEVNTTSSTAINFFTIENIGSGAVDVTIHATDLAGGDDTWDLSDTATPGENIYGLEAGLDDDDDLFDVIVRETEAYNELVNNLLESATQDWGLKLYMPTTVTDYDGQQMTATVTLVCSAH